LYRSCDKSKLGNIIDTKEVWIDELILWTFNRDGGLVY
jgi:hypothetical protein